MMQIWSRLIAHLKWHCRSPYLLVINMQFQGPTRAFFQRTEVQKGDIELLEQELGAVSDRVRRKVTPR
jgi:hypothetical protein